ncbi:hypothetical protein KIPB_009904, partial [Kipferlia bialata]|eukprot:g9904.t1
MQHALQGATFESLPPLFGDAEVSHLIPLDQSRLLAVTQPGNAMRTVRVSEDGSMSLFSRIKPPPMCTQGFSLTRVGDTLYLFGGYTL